MNTGLCNILRSKDSDNTWFNQNIKQMLLDQYIQKWEVMLTHVTNATKAIIRKCSRLRQCLKCFY